MKYLNAFQFVTMYAALPFIIAYLDRARFRWSMYCFWYAIATYIVLTFFMITFVYHAFCSYSAGDYNAY